MSTVISKDKAYKTWLEELKKRIQTSQIKAAIKVNSELLELYWQLGEEIIAKQKESTWGEAIIEQLSIDLAAAFPGMKGFSKRNLFYIRKAGCTARNITSVGSCKIFLGLVTIQPLVTISATSHHFNVCASF